MAVRREPLNRERVLRAAITLADKEGLDALTMRRVAQDLGVVPMTLYTYQDPTNEKVLQAIANQLRTNLGIEKVTFEAQPIAQLYEGFAGKSIKGPSLLYSGSPYPHIYAMADQMFSPAAPLNVTGYDSKTFTGLLAQAASSKDADSTTTFAKQAADQALADLPVAPLYWPIGGLVHSEKLSGVVPEVLGGARLSVVKVG